MTKTLKKRLLVASCLCFASAAVAFTGIANAFNASAEGTPSEQTARTAQIQSSERSAENAQFAVIDGRAASGSQGYKELYDGDTGTKYCIAINSTPYVTFKASSTDTIVTEYKLYTGDDTATQPGRNPKDWVLYGSNDYNAWTPIHTVENDKTMGAEDKTGYSFTIDNQTAYLFYKFEFTARRTEFDDTYDLMQLSEIEFTATASAPIKVSTAAQLKEAFINGNQAKLTADILLTEDLELYKKAFDLDLNGHVIGGTNKIVVYGASPDTVAKLFLSDSCPNATHADASLPSGGVITCAFHFNRKDEVVNGEKARLYANGGTLTQTVKFDTGYAMIDYFGDSMTVFEAGVSGCGTQLNGGVYYGKIESTNKTEFSTNVKKVAFENDDNLYVTEFVKAAGKAICPKPLQKENCEFWGWYKAGDGCAYDFSSGVSSNTTLRATWMKEVGSLADFKSALTEGYSVKLTSNVTLDTDLQVVQTSKHAVLDLNGFIIDGDKQLYVPGNATASELIVVDGNPTSDHSDTSYNVKGGYFHGSIRMLNCNNSGENKRYAKVFGNGGTIKEIYANSSAGEFSSVSSTPSVVKGVLSGGGILVKGGTFYGGKYDPSAERKIVFKDGENVFAIVGTSAKYIGELDREPQKSGFAFEGWYDGENKYDFSKPVIKQITLTAKWVEDNDAPVISGVEDGKAYCKNQEVTISDLHLDTVTVNGEAVALTNGKFVLDMSDCAEKKIVATDKALNTVEITVTFAHTFGEWQEKTNPTCTKEGAIAHKDCSECNRHFDADGNEIADVSIAKEPHMFGEWVDEVSATTEQEGVKGHKDCSVCGKHFDQSGNEIADLSIARLPEPPKEDGLSGGAIAGIAVGGVAVAGIGGFSIVWFVVKKRSFAQLIAAIKGAFGK